MDFMMKTHCILISGSTIAKEERLYAELEKNARVIRNTNNYRIESILKSNEVHLILVEISNHNNTEIEIIKNVKHKYPDVEILLLNGDGDVEIIASAIEKGAKDAFKKPYKIDLITERINAILQQIKDSSNLNL